MMSLLHLHEIELIYFVALLCLVVCRFSTIPGVSCLGIIFITKLCLFPSRWRCPWSSRSREARSRMAAASQSRLPRSWSRTKAWARKRKRRMQSGTQSLEQGQRHPGTVCCVPWWQPTSSPREGTRAGVQGIWREARESASWIQASHGEIDQYR
jgi:hypothetical protein